MLHDAFPFDLAKAKREGRLMGNSTMLLLKSCQKSAWSCPALWVVSAAAVNACAATCALHNVFFVQFFFPSTERGGTYRKI